jgi:uncharacterized protein YlzI (FlbEa/FlbD family)
VIALTRLHGDQFLLNEDMIERVDPHTGGTAIFTLGGNVYAVKEAAEDVAEAIRQEKAAIIRVANQVGSTRPRLSLVDDET